MIMLKDLFKKENIPYPEWLVDIRLDDEWKDSKYENTSDGHVWIVDNEIQHLKITITSDEYRFEGFDDQGIVIFTEIYTEDSHMII